ncbi:MAG: hypothetical protein IOC86_11305, partial [Aestuariivirga sp.]|nr:hypothetical protein [Aestuariivirga sp.]
MAGKATLQLLVPLLAAAMLLLAGVLPAAADAEARAGSYADITVDRSTPERHLKTFLTAVKRSILRMEAREWARNYYGAWLYPTITAEQSAEIRLLRQYMLDSMDLSGFPEWRRESAGIETALMLWDILAAE